MNDIDRLIDEKRQLEQEIDTKNTQMYELQLRGQENINFSNYNQYRNRSNSPENMSHSLNQFAAQSNSSLEMVLKEK